MGNLLTKCCTDDDRRKKKNNSSKTSPSSSDSSTSQERDIQLDTIAHPHQQQQQNSQAPATTLSNTLTHPQSTFLDGTVDSKAASLADQRINNSSTPRVSVNLSGKSTLQSDKKNNSSSENNNKSNTNSAKKKSSSGSFFKQLSSSFQNLTHSNNSTSHHSSSDKSQTTTHSGQVQSLSLAQGLEHFPVPLTAEECKVLLSNEIPASEIEKLSIGVDAGGMGIIHVAEWKGTKVAIKEASPHVISKEVEIYNRMKGYEGVVQFYGVTYPPGLDKLCIVTKYAENGSLSWHLKAGFHKLTWADKLMLATQISSSIARLHEQGIFHRDLHGGNILIDEAGNAMLTDFGASTMEERVIKSVDEYAIATLTTPEGKSKFVSAIIPSMDDAILAGANDGQLAAMGVTDKNGNQSPSGEDEKHDPLIGVMAYIAPERFRNPRYFDARCDIYSLGVLLWELTSGHSAFTKMPQDVQLAVSILNGKREESIEGTPEKYQALYERCWDADPEMRPSLDEILSTLAQVRAGLSDEQLAITRERNGRHDDGETDFEESLSVPRPTSDYQKYLISPE